MSRTIVLTGAPETSKLDWSAKSLTTLIQTAFPSTEKAFHHSNFTTAWRQLPTDTVQMRPTLPRLEIDPPLLDNIDNEPATFFSAAEHLSQDLGQDSAGSDVSAEDSRPSQDSLLPEDDDLSDFYSHSFSIHEAIPSSQITDVSVYTPGTPTYDSHDEMFSMTPMNQSGGIIKSPSERRLSQAPRPKRLSDLNDIPNGSYISAIRPQTMTVNLIVGILSISPPRKVTTGSYNGRRRHVELVELVVGDETKSGFNVSMWMPREMHVNWKDGAQEKPEGERSNLRRDMKILRPRDIILIQNVALSSFRGQVHGQSLRGDVTKVDLLFRKRGDDDERLGCYSVQNLRMATGRDQQIMKVKRVRDWIAESIGETTSRKSQRRERGPDYRGSQRMLLPDDTQ